MTAVPPREVATFLARPDPRRPIILLYGPDIGLVRERADALLASAVDDPSDPFALVKLDASQLTGDSSRLIDEAMTVPLFGGRRAIRVRGSSASLPDCIRILAGMPIRDCRIVIDGGDLRRESALRRVCEAEKNVAVIACYADSQADLASVLDEELRNAGLTIAAEARTTLVSLLGGDRQVSRNEIRKLTLYAHGRGEITLDDVTAVIPDASGLNLEPMIDGAFAGRTQLVEKEFAKAMSARTSPGLILLMTQRHAIWLHKSALTVSTGTPVETVLSWGIHFSRKRDVGNALRDYSLTRLAGIIERLAAAELDARKHSSLAAAIAQRALMAIAANARRRG
ncbi:MAG: DNA polymerase III subunit delta [Alphaproteobacteria bacterium]|nr:DNA polymerase III subunit delta [Alphaproteobacteria bacterium]